jgi:multidrug transporter EmrE-like cation transporter
MAAIGGVIATFLFESIEGEERRWASIAFMIGVFIASAIIGKSMKIGLPSSDRKKLVTTGMGTYVFLYLFMWILSYTLVHLPATGAVPQSPI